MKTFFFSLFFLGITLSASSQNNQYRSYLGLVNGLHSYGNATNFPTDLVADDYGPRSYTQNNGVIVPYNFHGGIDYNAPGIQINDDDEGDIILAVNQGVVHWAGIQRTGLKWIIVTTVISPTVTYNLCFEHVSENGDITLGQGLLTGGCRVKLFQDKTVPSSLSRRNKIIRD